MFCNILRTWLLPKLTQLSSLLSYSTRIYMDNVLVIAKCQMYFWKFNWSTRYNNYRIIWRTQIMSSTSTLLRTFLGSKDSSSLPPLLPILLCLWAFSSSRAFCSCVIYLSLAAIDVWFASRLLLASVNNRLYFETTSSEGASASADIASLNNASEKFYMRCLKLAKCEKILSRINCSNI